jgi:PAS domain S-box-containing protein
MTQEHPVAPEHQIARQKALLAVVTKIRQSLDLETIFTTTAQEVRQLLDADRVGMYRFSPDSHYCWGEFVSEAVIAPFTSTLTAKINDHCFGENLARYYQQGRMWACNDIYAAALPDCHIQILAQFQVRANLVVPLLRGETLWGLLCIHQCAGPRQWQAAEIEFVTQIALHLGVALQHAEAVTQLQQQSEYLREAVAKAVEREKAIAAIIDKIRRSLDLKTIFNTTVQEARHLLKADRVTIYRFNADWSGQFIVESVGSEWTSLLEAQQRDRSLCRNISECSLKALKPNTDTHLRETEGGIFSSGQVFRVADDIYTQGFSDCYLRALESYQARSYAIIAIYQGQELWGLLAAFQNSRPRHWQETEINFLVQIGAQLGVAIQQAELLEKTKRRSTELQSALTQQLQQRADELALSAERERAIAQVIDKIRLTLDLETIFQTATTEVRQLLEADRAAIYRFDPDSDCNEGEFVSEDVNPVFPSALSERIRDRCFSETAQAYLEGRIHASADVDNDNLAPCYLDILKRFGVRANLVVPLVQGDRLWGLLCIHQCGEPRQWQTREIEFASKIAVHLGVALQQAELLKQAERRSAQLQVALAQVQAQKEQQAKAANAERALTLVIDKIRQTLDLDTIFQNTATEVRQLLNTDRVAVFRFDPDSDCSEGEFVSEDVLPQFDSAMAARIRDRCFAVNRARHYQQGSIWAVDDIYTAGLAECHLKILERFNVRANLVAPLLKGSCLWGLLCIHQCGEPRQWPPAEIEFVTKIAVHLGVALQQAELLAQAQQRSLQLRTTLADLNAIVDNLADGLLVTDVQGYITRFNPALLEMFGLENVDLKGYNLGCYFPPELVALVEQSERHDQEVVTADVELGGDRSGQALATSIIKEADGEEGEQCLGSVILIRDVTVEREVDRMKTDFLATVSHELRTPLTSVLGFASIIKEKLEEMVFPHVVSRDRKVERAIRTIGSNVNIIIDEAERLTSLIDDVLDIAKMEAGRVDWHFEPSDPQAILERALAATSSLFETRNLELIRDFAPNLPSIYVDRDRLIQVLINLISNAVKFTETGSVTCRATVCNQDLCIEIIDTGIGIAPEDQAKVFERFQQVGDILTDKPKGTGLGLPICKQIIEQHGGRIWVNSQLGQGSTFAFTMPLRPLPIGN